MIKTRSEEGHLRFQTLSQRLRDIDIDVVHRVKSKYDTDPETGELGCHFQDTLEKLRNLDLCKPFLAFYYSNWTLVQSLPELIHHQKKVVNRLLVALRDTHPESVSSFLSLTIALSNDFREDLLPYFHHIFKTIVGRLTDFAYNDKQQVTPEIVGKAMETLASLLKYTSSQFIGIYHLLYIYCCDGDGDEHYTNRPPFRACFYSCTRHLPSLSLSPSPAPCLAAPIHPLPS